MRKTRKLPALRVFALALAALLILSAAAPAACAAEDRDTVRVGFFAFDGYHSLDEKGVRSGYGYDFLRMIARYWNVEYEYVGYDKSWNDMLDMLAAGEIDLVTSAQSTPEREERFAFSDPIGSSSAMLTTSYDNKTIASGKYSTYDGIRIGLLMGNSRNDDLKEFARKNRFSYTPIYFETHTELEQALASGEVDAILTSSLRQLNGERVLDYFSVEQFYAVVRKEDTVLLNKLNAAINQLNAVEGDWKNDLNNKHYFHWEERDLTFTPEERALIREYTEGEKQLVVSACMDKEPYIYMENGEAKGILLDYFAALAAYVGIPYEVVVPADRMEYLQWLDAEDPANVFLDGRFSSIYQAEERGRAITVPYTTMRLAMVTRRDFTGEIKTLAVSEAQGLFGIEEGLAPNAERLSVDSREEAMRAVLRGKADAAFVYLYTAQQFVNQDERGLLTYTMLEEPTYDYHIAFASTMDSRLAGIFTKAIYAMPSGTFENIASGYTSYRAGGVDLSTWIKIHPFYTLIGGLAVFTLCALTVVAHKREKRAVQEQNRAEEMRLLAEQAERASRAKSDFLANVSHDIRTPMNAIVGITALMEQEPGLSDHLRSYLQKLQSSSSYLLSIFDDVLDMRRVEAKQVILNRVNVSLSDALRQVESMVRMEAEKRRQTLRISIASLTHDAVQADSTCLQRVAMNLLSNAVKYTPEGGTITVTLEELGSTDGEHADFRLTVEDNGVGMPPELVERLFEPFARGESSVTNKIHGTGLGMAITKGIVDAMGGTITVDSAPGKGSRFAVTLTLALAESAAEEKTEVEALCGRCFLCAEDNELNAEILTELLHLRGAECVIYSDGAALVRAFEAVEEGEFDAILMDIQMPVMNGLDAARALRAGKNPLGRSIPIIAMTANVFAEDVAHSLDAGMDAHISKPIDIEELNRTVARLCRTNSY